MPPEALDDLPPQPPRRPDADGVFRLGGLFGGIEASVAGSDGEWFFEDFRKAAWSGRFRFRCRVPYTGLAPWKGRVSMNFKGTKVAHNAFRILDIAPAANTGLTDETDGDREGGWTDQGRNDLSALAGGAELQSRFVPLRVVPRAIVLAGGERTYFPAESGEIPVGFTVRRLDFLHAVAWVKVLGNPEGGAVPMVLGVTALDAERITDRQFRALENLFQNKPRNDVDTSAWYPCGLPWGAESVPMSSWTG